MHIGSAIVPELISADHQVPSLSVRTLPSPACQFDQRGATK